MVDAEEDQLYHLVPGDRVDAEEDQLHHLVPGDRVDGIDFIWQENKDGNAASTKLEVLKKSALHTFFMTIVCGVFIAFLTICLVYFNLNFANLCDSTDWKELPFKIQNVHIFSKCISDQLLMFWYVFDISLVFPLTNHNKKVVVLICLLAGCVATIYRLSTRITNIYATSNWLGIPQYIILISTSFFASWNAVSNNNTYTTKTKIKYSVLMNIQVIMAFFIYSFNLYVIVPAFVKVNFTLRFLISISLPLIGYIARTISRFILLRFDEFPTENIYILCAGLYALTTLYYRIFQANVVSILNFMYMGFIHGVVGFLERLSVMYQKPILGYFFSKCGCNGYEIERTPREKRVLTDMLIMGIVYEIWGSITTNGLLVMYAIQQSIPQQHGTTFHISSYITDVTFKIIYSVIVDYLFILSAVSILVWKRNLPINYVWDKRWRQITLILSINALFPILAASKVMTVLTEKSYYEHLSDRGDMIIAERLKMCNYTLHPFK